MFNWFNRTPQPSETRSSTESTLSSPEEWLAELFGGARSVAGAAVTPRTAMRCPAVKCAVETIAETIGQLPVHVYRTKADGSRERATDHPAYVLLHDDANAWTPAGDLREQITRDALLHGNGYAFCNRVNGELREWDRLDPESVTVRADLLTNEPSYIFNRASGGQIALSWRDVIHIKAPSCDGLVGISPILQAREAIGVALVIEEHVARLFGNGARPSGILKFPKTLGDVAAKRIKGSWNAAHAGGGNSGRTAVLEDGGDFQALTFSSVDAQLLELRKFCIEEIARAYRVPPIFLMEFGRATWSNGEQMGEMLINYTIMRWIKAWEGQFRLKIFAPAERETFHAEFLLDDLLRANLAQRAAAYASLIASRVLNPNEARAAENRPPYAGGEVFANPNTTTSAPPKQGASEAA